MFKGGGAGAMNVKRALASSLINKKELKNTDLSFYLARPRKSHEKTFK